MEKIVDAKGLACPKPVILTKKAIESIEEGRIKTIVDNEISKNNLSKLAKSMGLEYKIEEDSQGNYEVYIIKGKGQALDSAQVIKKEEVDNASILVIPSDLMGAGDPELGRLLMKSFIYTVSETRPYPKTILFYNSGVKLTIKSNPVLEDLINLEEAGVEIISCGTCLDFYGLQDQLGVGQISNMYTLYEKMNQGQNTIVIG